MHAWGLRLRSACVALAIYRAPQYCLPVGLTPSAHLILAISELIDFRDTQPACAPVQRFKRGVAHRPHMARGQDGFATPFLLDSFIHNFTPVYPDAIQAMGPPY
jgi:hypothetical protein